MNLRHRQLQYSLQKIDAHSVQRTQDLFLLVEDMNLGHLDNSRRKHGRKRELRIARRLASADAASFMAAGILLYRYSVEYKNLELLVGTGRSGRLSILGGKQEDADGLSTRPSASLTRRRDKSSSRQVRAISCQH